MSGRHIDITVTDATPGGVADGRPWIGVQFECCGVYQRIYRQPDDRQYCGKCPTCGRSVTVTVGPNGVNSRIFRAK